MDNNYNVKKQGFVEREIKTAISVGVSPNEMDQFIKENPNLKNFSITKCQIIRNMMIEEDDENDWY